MMVFVAAYGQEDNGNREERVARRKECREIRQVFRNKEGRKQYKRYAGVILRDGDYTFSYGKESIVVYGLKEDLTGLFTSGILHPYIGYNEPEPAPDTLRLQGNVALPLVKFHVTKMDNVKELNCGRKSYKVRRFSFWLYQERLVNPTEYYFELTNKKANSKTSLTDFVKGAQLTCYIMHTIII